MSWDRAWSHTVVIAVDQLAAAVFFNRSDVTVSSLCRVVQLADAGVEDFPERLRYLNLSDRQVEALRWIGTQLDKRWPGHCEGARLGDLGRQGSARSLLQLATESLLVRPKDHPVSISRIDGLDAPESNHSQ